MPSKSVAHSNKQETSRNESVARWIQELGLSASVSDDTEFDPDDILARMLNAESFEDALAAQESSILSGKLMVGVPHTINDFTVRKSDDKYSGIGYYTIVNGVRHDTGEPITYAVGAPNVMVILWQAGRFGLLPGDFQIHSRETQNGELLSLKPFKGRAVQGNLA